MLKRLAGTGLNLAVLGVSVAVFVAAFIILNALGAAQRPPTFQILAAARDLAIGEVIAADSLAVRTVFQDDNATLYIPAEQAEGVVGGIVAQAMVSGQPVFRSAILAHAAEGTRLSAALAEHPGHSLFPLPLDAINVVAPELSTFLPGDLVGITVVIASRPQQFSTPTPLPDLFLSGEALVQPGATPDPVESAIAEAQSRSFPPLAKDLFPQGVRVMAVQGLPPATDSGEDGSSSFSSYDQPEMLILLLPNAAREVLSLAMQQGDRLVVSLLARGEDNPTAGFSYWDFEDLFKAERDEVLKGGR